MGNEKVYNMAFAKVYPLLIAKAEKKGRARAEVLEVTAWLTGYTHTRIWQTRVRGAVSVQHKLTLKRAL